MLRRFPSPLVRFPAWLQPITRGCYRKSHALGLLFKHLPVLGFLYLPLLSLLFLFLLQF